MLSLAVVLRRPGKWFLEKKLRKCFQELSALRGKMEGKWKEGREEGDKGEVVDIVVDIP